MIKNTIAATAIAAAVVAVPGTALAQAESPASSAVVKPVASPVEDQRATAAFTSYLGAATAVGGLGGTAIGAAAGCLIAGAPAVVGGPLVVPACLAGAATGAAIGGVVGTLVAGGPTLVIAGADLVGTLTAQPGTTRWADAK